MPTAAWIRLGLLVVAALVAACGGTSRVADELTASSLSQSKKAVALIKLGAADPLCSVLAAGIGVRDGNDFRLIQTARIERNAGEPRWPSWSSAAASITSSATAARGPAARCACRSRPAAASTRRAMPSFSLAPGEILNVGYLQLVTVGATPISAYSRVLHVRLAVTDWPLAEIDRFKQQRPNLYGQMRTRLMTVHKVEPPTMAQVQAKCAEMRRLQAEGKLQNLPTLCTPGGGAGGGPPAAAGRRQQQAPDRHIGRQPRAAGQRPRPPEPPRPKASRAQHG